MDAAATFHHRLPECFAGFPRDETGVTVEYPGALRPQAWSAAAPLSCLRTFLGLDVVNGNLRVRRTVPEQMGRLKLSNVHVRGRSVDV
jgi:glycogen debranching enzyme